MCRELSRRLKSKILLNVFDIVAHYEDCYGRYFSMVMSIFTQCISHKLRAYSFTQILETRTVGA